MKGGCRSDDTTNVDTGDPGLHTIVCNVWVKNTAEEKGIRFKELEVPSRSRSRRIRVCLILK